PDGPRVPLLTVALHQLLDTARYPRHRGAERVLDVEQPELVAREVVEGPHHVATTGLARAPQVPHVERRRVARDQRAVDVEERGDHDRLGALDHHRDPLPATDAERGDAEPGVARAHGVEEGHEDATAARADRMAERDRAAVHVDAVLR